MLRLLKKPAIFLVMLTLTLPSFGFTKTFSDEKPSGGAMFADAIIARPLLLGATVVGAGLYLVMLPFTLAGGNAGDSAKFMVVGPAQATFARCLGCTVSQNERLRIERNTERANK